MAKFNKSDLIATMQDFVNRALHANEIRDFESLKNLPEQFVNGLISEGLIMIHPKSLELAEINEDVELVVTKNEEVQK